MITAPAKPRVLMLSQEVHPIPPMKGAAVEQWIEAVAHRLKQHVPYVVSVPHPERPDDEQVGNVHYRRIRMSPLYKRLFRKLTRLDPYPYVSRILRYAHVISPDIVHIHNAPQFVDVLSAGLPQAKMVLHMHNEKLDSFHSKVNTLVGCSHYIQDWYQLRKTPAQRFHVIDNGVDPAMFDTSSHRSQVSTIRGRFGVPDDRFVVLYVGRISPEKGPDLIVRAMQQLDPEKFHLVISGEWPEGSPERSERVRYARSLRDMLQTVPHTITGGVPPAEVPDIYRLGDLLLITSRFEEPFSMVAIEAMASGLPVMALRKGGMVEYMVHNENALLLDADASVEAIASAVREASCSRDELVRISHHARHMVETRFGWEEVARQTESLYTVMLSGKAN